MVGEGVLHECLNHPDVESVLVINRRSCNVTHPKLKEIIHDNFYDLSSIRDQLGGYNACFFCLGTTSIGKKEDEYRKITFELTKTFADTFHEINPEMTFCYVSGSGTDSSEEGKLMWARVKGRTENYILNLGFKNAYMFRPALIIPTKGLNNTLTHPREVLLEQVWGYRHAADTRLVNVHVQRLRAKIETDPENPTIVVTVRGVGYKAGLADESSLDQ